MTVRIRLIKFAHCCGKSEIQKARPLQVKNSFELCVVMRTIDNCSSKGRKTL